MIVYLKGLMLVDQPPLVLMGLKAALKNISGVIFKY